MVSQSSPVRHAVLTRQGGCKLRRALEGIRIADFTQAWAGPFATRILAAMGAQVIKVEGPKRMDGWRGGMRVENPARYPNGDGGDRPWNRCALFNTQNHNKLAIAVDLKHPEGAALARRLVAVSHVVIHNFRPGAMERLGLGYNHLKQVKPDLIYVAMPAMGDNGPRSHYMGWGPNFEANSGQCAILGYPGERPISTNYAFSDPVGGLHGASAVMTALMHWRRTGEGQYVEVSQQEAALPYVGEYLLDYAANGRVHGPRGNRHAWAAPHDAYRCRGDDQWVAIDVRSDEQWKALCDLIGRPELIDDPRYALASDRHRNQDDLRPIIETWTRERDKHSAAQMLLAAGVPAAPVNDARDLTRDPHLHARGFFHKLTHPEAGTHPYPGLAIHLSATPARIERPSPCFAEHNELVLREVLGLRDDEIRRLAEAGVLADTPQDHRREMYAAATDETASGSGA